MAKPTYHEAMKLAKADKPKDSFITIRMDTTIIVPHKAGVAIIDALANAEKIGRWGDKPIEALSTDDYTVQPMSPQKYLRHKVAVLMGVTVGEVEAAERGAEEAAAQP